MKLIRIGDTVINVERITRIELETTSYDYEKTDSVAATRVYFGSAPDSETNPDNAVFTGSDRATFKAWLADNCENIHETKPDRSERGMLGLHG